MGITFPQPSTTAQEQLLARLNDEKTADALNRLLDRLEVVAFVAEALDGFLGRANVVADSVAASMADLRKMAGDSGTSGVVDSIPKLAKAGVKLADATVVVLGTLIERRRTLTTLARMVSVSESLTCAVA